MEPVSLLPFIFEKALVNCSPDATISKSLQRSGDDLLINDRRFSVADRPVCVLAVGKASAPMYRATKEILGFHISEALIITPSGDAPTDDISEYDDTFQCIRASHPYPNKQSLDAGKQAVAFMDRIPRNALVLTLISGGTSSLMCKPQPGISVSDLSVLYRLLSNSGATIKEMNTVRKQCSAVKGGQLLEQIRNAATVINLAISDVPGNDISLIGSGPTARDSTTLEDAVQVLHHYGLWDGLPESVEQYFTDRSLPKSSHHTQTLGAIPTIINYHSFIMGSAKGLAEKVSKLAKREGLQTWVAAEPYNDDVAKVARDIAKRAIAHKKQSEKPKLLIFYGESTVQVTGDGKGGRNQELALRGALEIADHQDICWLSAGTDGIDGPTDAAGAIVDSQTIMNAKTKGVDPDKYIRNNNSYHFHEMMDTHIKTGATGNNLMDLTLVWIEGA